MIADLAALVGLAAVFEVRAGITALPGPSVAGQTSRAVLVHLAPNARDDRHADEGVAFWIGIAGSLRCADVALWARAAWLVEDHLAKGVDAAHAPERARIETLGVDASLFVRTFVIARALLLCG